MSVRRSAPAFTASSGYLTLASCALLLSMAACAGDGASTHRADTAHLKESNTCTVRDTGSRWGFPGAKYEPSDEYGGSPSEALIDVWGIDAMPDGEIVVFDAGNTRALRLSPDLELIERFGGEGPGPGEFVYQRALHGDWVAASDSSIFILDLKGFSEFDPNGRFKDYATRQTILTSEIKRIAAPEGRLVYVKDVIDRSDGRRALETWRVRPSGEHDRVRIDSMPPLPRWHGRLVRGVFADQAEPLWDLHRRCAFVSDGSSDWLLRIDLTGERVDTLYLPTRRIPSRTRQDERRLERLRLAASRAGMSAGAAEAEPTARLKWRDMLIDPDGFVWLEPWRPYSMRGSPLMAWVVDPRDGTVDSVMVQLFPKAFLPGGEFVGMALDTVTGSGLLKTFSLADSM